MSEGFIGEIRMVGFGFAPRNWAVCDGKILSIAEHQTLFSILGTRYGGNGSTTFALPDLRGRTPIHVSWTGRVGSHGGEERHALTIEEMPIHTHGFKATSVDGAAPSPRDNLLAKTPVDRGNVYNNSLPTDVALNPETVTNTGSGAGHENMQPYQAICFCICIRGLYPDRN